MSQNSTPPYDPSSAPGVPVDGFSDLHIVGDTFRFVAFSLQPVAGTQETQAVPVVKLITSHRAIRKFSDQIAQTFDAAKKQNGGRTKRR